MDYPGESLEGGCDEGKTLVDPQSDPISACTDNRRYGDIFKQDTGITSILICEISSDTA